MQLQCYFIVITAGKLPYPASGNPTNYMAMYFEFDKSY